MRFLFLFLLVVLLTSSTRCSAAPNAATNIMPSDFASLFARGRVLLDSDDARALETLQSAVDVSKSANKTEQIQATLSLARATQKWRTRDETIAVLARGLQQNDVAQLRDALAPLMQNGLPIFASYETLKLLSKIVARGQWKPQRFNFALPQSALPQSALVSDKSKAAKTNVEYSMFDESRASNTDTSNLNSSNLNFSDLNSSNLKPQINTLVSELLLTDGALSIYSVNKDGAPQLWRTPPLYSAYSDLPTSLKMNRAVYGYARQSDDSWRQVARVFYADLPAERERAQQTIAQFLRVWSSFQGALQRDNLYAPVTTIWLSRESALWPQAENTSNWNAGAQLDSAPGEMILFRSNEARSGAEWLREIAHEYSHLALPPFAGYQSPLEPFGNGVQGETLLMLWALQNPSSFFATSESAEAQQLRVHVARHAIAAWKSWISHDPRQPIIGDDEAARQLLQGLTLWTDRVYGAPVLRAALSNLGGGNEKTEAQRQAALILAQRRSAQTNLTLDVLRAETLRAAIPNAVESASLHFVDNRVSIAMRLKATIWIGGALHSTEKATLEMTPEELASRAALTFRANARVEGWIYVPRDAKTLRIELPTSNATSSTRSAIVVAGWKVSFAQNALTLDCRAKSGWQKISLRATQNVQLRWAQFQ